MEGTMTAIEMTGTIDAYRQLRLDSTLPISAHTRVRVLVLYPLNEEWDETEWLQAAARNPAFAFLSAPEEDIYPLTDGTPFHDKVSGRLQQRSLHVGFHSNNHENNVPTLFSQEFPLTGFTHNE